jgi:hypothetical protein
MGNRMIQKTPFRCVGNHHRSALWRKLSQKAMSSYLRLRESVSAPNFFRRAPKVAQRDSRAAYAAMPLFPEPFPFEAALGSIEGIALPEATPPLRKTGLWEL